MTENLAQLVIEAALNYADKKITLEGFLGVLVTAIAELDVKTYHIQKRRKQ